MNSTMHQTTGTKQRVKARANFNPTILVGCDVKAAPIVPCLECGGDLPLTSLVLFSYVDGRSVPYCICSQCNEAFADAIPYKTQTAEERAAHRRELERLRDRRAALLRKHLHDRAMPVARALVTNLNALARAEGGAAPSDTP